jgi:rhamnogalacturonyl hydrolase YesR
MTEEMWKEKLSIKIRQGYLTEADKKRFEQAAKAILSSPIEEVSKHWIRLCGEDAFYPGDDRTNFEAVIAVYTYPGVTAYFMKALDWEEGL